MNRVGIRIRERYNIYGGVDLTGVNIEAVVGFYASGTPIAAPLLASE